MSLELYRVNQNMETMGQLAQQILGLVVENKKIQAEHPHDFKFHHQTNAYHNKLWHVVYACPGCGATKTEKKEPVCSSCDINLFRCDATDTEAEAERQKPEHKERFTNLPMAFRCPRCRKVHILAYNGD